MIERAGRFVAQLLILAAVSPLAAQSTSPASRRSASLASPEATTTVGAADANAYRIGAEDMLDISVWNNEAVSRVVPVRPDGRISLPLLPDIPAAGLTTTELRDNIRRGLAAYINAPEVSVIVREVHSFKVSVMGEVKNPGRYELKSRATVLDALALAGGFSDFADRSRIMVIHGSGASAQRTVFNYKRFVSEGVEDCPALKPGDVVVVP